MSSGFSSPENQDAQNVLFNPLFFGRKPYRQFRKQILVLVIFVSKLPLINLPQNCDGCYLFLAKFIVLESAVTRKFHDKGRKLLAVAATFALKDHDL